MVAVLILQELEKCRSLYIHAEVTIQKVSTMYVQHIPINILYDRNLSEKQGCSAFHIIFMNKSAS